ncbi:MAG: HAD family hydrolase [Actinobacteria bacterium]|nr:HAD family hydrolase [Actinomycetota bacterium]
MKPKRIEEILAKIKGVKVAVYGDFCLDAYWMLDPRGSEVSVETNLQGQAVSKQHYTLGGASNIVANLAALEPTAIQVVGVIGDDIFGRELTRQLGILGVDTTWLTIQKQSFDTVVFGKRYLQGNEQPRLDFGVFNQRTETTDETLLEGLRDVLQTADAVIFNQQVPGSITNLSFIDEANSLFDEFSDKIILVDSRHYGDRFRNIYRKVNDIEAARLSGAEVKPGDVVALEDVKRYAENLYAQSGKPVFVTRGQRGILVVDSAGTRQVPGIQLLQKIDTVGAGDTTINALALCLAAGFTSFEAAEFANITAAVTIQKLFQTGTANPQEILQLGRDPDYIYQPELAEDIRQAHYLEDSEIELCYERSSIPFGRIKHALFDHDGTISTLRQGWEEIMEPMMVKAILGEKYRTADETLYHKVVNRVRAYIDTSTGIQTILQMEALVEMVKEFGLVPPERMLDKFGYKKIYNDVLMDMVQRRISKFKRGQLDINDYTIKGSLAFLQALRKKGIRLYLASGTDQEDVLAETSALGYADLFEGRIYGSVGDISKYSKKMVMSKIMNDNRLQGPELAVFGDGPVEIRESRKREGIAVGLATDEIRRHDLNTQKRTRLIKAGAHIIVPDFSEADRLLSLLLDNN